MESDDINNQPLDSFTKKELEALKLKTEILKLRSEIQEKNKPWVIKNLPILIPSLIGLLTILTGYFTGYFDVESKLLEIKKHDLTLEITSFQQKKDTLNKRNIELYNFNKNLSKETDKLKADTFSLANGVKIMKTKATELSFEKTKLNNQISSLGQEKSNLLNSTVQLKDELNKSSFNVNLNKLLSSLGMNGDGYADLISIIKRKDKYYDHYLTAITHSLDTTNNIYHKGILMCLMYEITNKPLWKEGLFNLGNKLCDDINTNTVKDPNTWSFYFIFSNYQVFQPKTTEERLDIVNYLINIIRKIRSSNYDNRDGFKQSILYNLSSLGGISSELIDRDSENFCYLIKTCNNYCLNETNGGYISQGVSSFLQDSAPIAFLCVLSELMQTPKKYAAQSLREFQAKAFDIFEKNKNNIDKPSDLTSPNSWKEWQQRHSDLIDIDKNVYSFVDNKTALKRLLGSPY